jgi:hypothetical protein
VLSVIYSCCVTAELALEGQNADRDRDIPTALRAQVSELVGRQVEKLDLTALPSENLAARGISADPDMHCMRSSWLGYFAPVNSIPRH